jgi:hypothetical protein
MADKVQENSPTEPAADGLTGDWPRIAAASEYFNKI